MRKSQTPQIEAGNETVPAGASGLVGNVNSRSLEAICDVLNALLAKVASLEAKLEHESIRQTRSAQLMKLEEVATRWQVSPRTVSKEFAEGCLVATYIRGAQRFSIEAVEAVERANTRAKPKRTRRRSKA